MKAGQLKIYEIKCTTPMGVATYEVEAGSYVDASVEFHRQHPRYPIIGLRMKFISETAKPYSLDDPLPDNARPLRRDLD